MSETLSMAAAGGTHTRGNPRASTLLAAHQQQAPPDPPAPRQRTVLGPQTYVNLATVAAILAVGIPLLFAVWDIRQTVRGSWTIEDQREFTRRLERQNPGIIVPDIVEVIRARLAGVQP
jgi:hypothetical protein